MIRRSLFAAAALLLAASPAAARELAFTAQLSGQTASTSTGSKATGQARILVDTEAKTVDVSLDVAGLKPDELRTTLVAKPIGPIHMHLYASRDHGPSAGASLVLPLPYGPSYSATADGFQVRAKAMDYAHGASLVNGTASFDEFVAALQSGQVVLNIHTNRFPEGEISGDVTPAS
jgi:hypothetical protein